MTSTSPVTATLKSTWAPEPDAGRRLARTQAWLENFRRHKSPVVAQVAPGALVVLRRNEPGEGPLLATCSCGAVGGCGHVAAAVAEWGLR